MGVLENGQNPVPGGSPGGAPGNSGFFRDCEKSAKTPQFLGGQRRTPELKSGLYRIWAKNGVKNPVFGPNSVIIFEIMVNQSSSTFLLGGLTELILANQFTSGYANALRCYGQSTLTIRHAQGMYTVSSTYAVYIRQAWNVEAERYGEG